MARLTPYLRAAATVPYTPLAVPTNIPVEDFVALFSIKLKKRQVKDREVVGKEGGGGW